MPTIEEIRTDWKTIRSKLGNLICYIDGKSEQLQDMSEAYRKGYNDGIEKSSLDVKDRVSCAYQDGYAEGLEDAWETACRRAGRRGYQPHRHGTKPFTAFDAFAWHIPGLAFDDNVPSNDASSRGCCPAAGQGRHRDGSPLLELRAPEGFRGVGG